MTGYIEKKADKAATTQSRIVEDALLLYINDSLAEDSERIAALSIWNERNRAAYYTTKTEEES